MKKYDQIHETVLKAVFDIYDDIKGLADGDLENLIKKHKGTRPIKSIANVTNDLICVFPVLSSRNISIDAQSMACKAIEKDCVAMLQMLFSAVQLSDARDAFEYIQTFHTNINKSAKLLDLDDVLHISDAIGITDSAIQVGGKVDTAIVEQVKKDMRNLNFFFEDSTVSSKSIDEKFTCNLDPKGQYIVEVSTINPISEFSMTPNLDIDPKLRKIKDLQDKVNSLEDENELLKIDSFRAKSQLHSTKTVGDLTNIARNISAIGKDNTEALNKQVINGDYKKANELMPTLMAVNFKSKVGDRYEIVESVVIGVKAKLYPISSEDMITHIVAKAKDANWVQKFIKASTREISFFKDFLFAIDKAKVDALSMSKKGSSNKMWKVLERRAIKSRWNRLMAKSNDATAITTIMLSQNEVDFIKKEYLIDISDVSNTRVLMENFNLLGICIIDESLEIAKFMFDTGEDMWETVSFSNLERESNDNTYKKVVNLMTKIM